MSLNLEQAEQLCRTDLDFFASVCLPEITTSIWPDFYKEAWSLLLLKLWELRNKDDPTGQAELVDELFRFALGLPRGHAKTTFIKLLISYCLLYGLIDFPLVVGSSEPRGQDILSDVWDILCSDNIAQIYGSWKAGIGKDTKEVKTCRFNGRDIIMVAIGAGTSIRGLNLKNKRPDFILFDDAQTAANDESPTERANLLRWVVGTAIKLRNPRRCMVVWVGNMYSEECLLYKFHQSSKWLSLITGAILADGSALWPQIRSISSLMEEYEHDAELGEADTWFAELQNDPRGAKRGLLPDGIIPAPIEPPNPEDRLGSFITIDPAGNKKNSDDNVIAVQDVYPDWKIDIPELSADVMDPETVIITAITYAIKYRSSTIFVEAVAYQQTLAFWMNKYLTAYELAESIEIVELAPGKATKLSRIRAWIKTVLDGSSTISSMIVRNRVLFQALAFKIDRTNNVDDILDCCAQGQQVKNKYQDKIHLTLQDIPSTTAKVRTNNTPITTTRRRSTHG